MDTKDKKIELRSENMRNIIGQVPPFIIRWGNIILCLILIILILFAVLIPLPYKINAPIYVEEVLGYKQIVVSMPNETAIKLEKGLNAKITLSAYSNKHCTPIEAQVEIIYGKKELKSQTLYRKVLLNTKKGINNEKEELLQIREPQNGSIIITMRKQTCWEMVSHK